LKPKFHPMSGKMPCTCLKGAFGGPENDPKPWLW
jgi:hypothetical protein